MKKKNLNFDVVVIGSGLAGQYIALRLNENLKVAIITKKKLETSNSYLAQGGIACELNNDNEKLKSHIVDTLKAGASLNDNKALETLVSYASNAIEKLISLGVNFDKDSDGNIAVTREGGHSNRRILHAGGDATGLKIMQTLIKETRKRKNIVCLENMMAVELIREDNSCFGIRTLDNYGNLYNIFGKKTIIATGGIGGVFKNSTNPSSATGDGLGLAFRQNVLIDNLEFTQFHPTSFYTPKVEKDGSRFLISEAVRGEGGLLKNVDGQEFMHKYHPLKELAPRDIVSQGIHREMYDTWSEHVYIDVTHMDKKYLKQRFPSIYKKCLKNGYKMESDYIPVAPIQHYSIGGIVVDLNGKTSLNNLYANGECTHTGVHGANRLASNSLLECIVFGEKIVQNINGQDLTKEIDYKEIKLPNLDFESKRYKYTSVSKDIKDVVQKYVGIIRKKDELNMALNIVQKHYDNLVANYQATKSYYEALNIATTALLLIEGAIKREQSIGCHFRID